MYSRIEYSATFTRVQYQNSELETARSGQEANVSLLRMTKSAHFLSESLLLMAFRVSAISEEDADANDTSGTLRSALFWDCTRGGMVVPSLGV